MSIYYSDRPYKLFLKLNEDGTAKSLRITYKVQTDEEIIEWYTEKYNIYPGESSGYIRFQSTPDGKPLASQELTPELIDTKYIQKLIDSLEEGSLYSVYIKKGETMFKYHQIKHLGYADTKHGIRDVKNYFEGNFKKGAGID